MESVGESMISFVMVYYESVVHLGEILRITSNIYAVSSSLNILNVCIYFLAFPSVPLVQATGGLFLCALRFGCASTLRFSIQCKG